MQTIKLPRLFWAYLRRHARLIALFAVFSLVFGVVFALYDLPVEAVAYASAICLALGGVAAAFGLNAFRHRHEALVALRENAALGVDDMPPPRDLLEEDLQAIIRRLQSGWQEEISRADQERADMLEYYTLWVHQAKTPLAAMGLLLAGREDAAALEAERFKLERYVDMALQYARLGADASDFVLRECALAPIVRGAVRKYARLFIAKRIHLTVEEMDARVLTDDKWLSFAIEQLLSNAVKYTGENGHIRISLCEPLSLVIEDDGIGIQPETYVKLAQHPNIAAIKEANSDISKIVETFALVGDQLDIYSGNDDQIVPILSMGGQGCISVLSNVVPRETVAITDQFFAGNVAESARLQCQFMPLIRSLFCESNPIPVKAAMSALGFCENYLRLPLVPMEQDHYETMLQRMRALGLSV